VRALPRLLIFGLSFFLLGAADAGEDRASAGSPALSPPADPGTVDAGVRMAQAPAPPSVPSPTLPGAPISPAPTAPAPAAPRTSPITSAPPLMPVPRPGSPPGAISPGAAYAAVAPLAPIGGGFAPPATGFGTLAGTSSGSIFQMIGDQGPAITFRQASGVPAPPALPPPFPPSKFPTPPKPALASALAPAVRGFKIAENQSPLPQDRVFFTFDFFDNVNAALNRRFEAPVDNLRVYREIFGLEKTFDQGRGSLGAILPLNTVTADSTIQGQFNKPGGTSTALGDLSIFLKYILKINPETGNLISVGLAATPPTGPNQFAGASYLQSVHATSIQPFVGYILRGDRLFLHGFSALDVPTSVRDVTMVYNDLGLGYFLYRDASPTSIPFVSAVVPTIEAHVNTPLTHRDPFNPKDPTGTPDVVNLTYGLNVEVYRRSVLTFGFVTPVTGPRPFDYEFLLLFNRRFGGSRVLPRPTPPILGG
jgi:hypothetical protein